MPFSNLTNCYSFYILYICLLRTWNITTLNINVNILNQAWQVKESTTVIVTEVNASHFIFETSEKEHFSYSYTVLTLVSYEWLSNNIFKTCEQPTLRK